MSNDIVTSQNTVSSFGNYNSATSKGTKIVKAGTDMDKNAFLKILAAELTNQDPMSAKDSTQYVSQMAQFTSMEQMANLNTTMSTYAANSLIGKGVVTNVTDINGVAYAGVVRDVTSKSGQITLGVEVRSGDSTEIMDFNFSEIKTVADTTENSLDNLSSNTALMAAANMIGKKGEFNIQDESGNNLVGLVKGIIKENGLLKLRVQPEGSVEIKTVTLDNLIKLDSVD